MDRFRNLPSPLWVFGTGTGVGKTFVSSRIARAWAEQGPVTYRKPFQTGVDRPGHPDADETVVAGPGIAVESGVLLRAPLSPLAAAQLEDRRLDLEALSAWCGRPVAGRLLLEGVGGLLVPLAPQVHFLAWATEVRWPAGVMVSPADPAAEAHPGLACRRPLDAQRIPCVLVALGGLGTLNHTLLSAEALMMRGWRIEAVILDPGADGVAPAVAEQNAEILRGFLPVPVVVF